MKSGIQQTAFSRQSDDCSGAVLDN